MLTLEDVVGLPAYDRWPTLLVLADYWEERDEKGDWVKAEALRWLVANRAWPAGLCRGYYRWYTTNNPGHLSNPYCGNWLPTPFEQRTKGPTTCVWEFRSVAAALSWFLSRYAEVREEVLALSGVEPLRPDGGPWVGRSPWLAPHVGVWVEEGIACASTRP